MDKRNIKFRGLDTETHTVWLHGMLSCYHYEHSTIKTNYGDVIVEYASVGEYTGLSDKEGKDIYEDDVIQTSSDGAAFQVVWNSNMGIWDCKKLYRGNIPPAGPLLIPLYHLHKECVVIGNIYDGVNI